MSIVELDTPYQKRKALLALYGIFIMLSTAFLGTWFCGLYLSQNMAIIGGCMCVMLVGGVLGYFTVVVQQAVQEVNIKVVQE